MTDAEIKEMILNHPKMKDGTTKINVSMKGVKK